MGAFCAATLVACLSPTYPELKILWSLLAAVCCWQAARAPGAALAPRRLIIGVNGQVLLKTGTQAFRRGELLPHSWSSPYFAVLNLQLSTGRPLGVLVLAAGQEDAFRRLRCRCRHQGAQGKPAAA